MGESPPSPASPPAQNEPYSELHNELRFDIAVVKRVIASAGRMQAKSHALAHATQAQRLQTLSAKEIENLAGELSLDPTFIRRALTQVRADLQTEAAATSAQRAKRALYRRAFHIAVRPVRAPFFCLLALSATLPWLFTPRPDVNWFYVYIPFTLVFLMTALSKQKSRRRAVGHAVGQGVGFGLAGLGALFVSATGNHWGYPDAYEFRIVVAAFLGGATLAALLGAAVGAALRRGFAELLEAAAVAEKAEMVGKSQTL